ncbi:MAG: hypothetical protein II948_11315 [Synergistaceae bacterium]|nr:hypothetical protein [Synergistaceae bacterium]MBQ4418357.1 hypothetical protein [Synergistaceae bacterium]MBQ7570046.1 hypothetical protein [Synergistaceae bacterium]MBR0095569.1 hypothetical protein [Synergistaceae bacterium]MBR0221784.1 hypothetical protein [Synergistaceae bacterium]
MKMLMRDSLKLEEGIAIGERRGIIKGTRLGERKEKFSTAQRLISMGLSLADICKATQLSLEDLQNL